MQPVIIGQALDKHQKTEQQFMLIKKRQVYVCFTNIIYQKKLNQQKDVRNGKNGHYFNQIIRI